MQIADNAIKQEDIKIEDAILYLLWKQYFSEGEDLVYEKDLMPPFRKWLEINDLIIRRRKSKKEKIL